MNKFDKFLWRINGFIILSVGISALIAVTFIFLDFQKRDVQNIVSIKKEDIKSNIELEIGYFQKINSNADFLAPLYLTQNIDRSYYSKNSSNNIKNYLFVNLNRNIQKWLFNTNEYLIFEKRDIYKVANSHRAEEISNFLFTVIRADSNGDEVLNYQDRKDIYISEVDGSNLTLVLKDIDKIVSISQYENNLIAIFYEKDSKIYSSKINTFLRKEIENLKIKDTL